MKGKEQRERKTREKEGVDRQKNAMRGEIGKTKTKGCNRIKGKRKWRRKKRQREEEEKKREK